MVLNRPLSNWNLKYFIFNKFKSPVVSVIDCIKPYLSDVRLRCIHVSNVGKQQILALKWPILDFFFHVFLEMNLSSCLSPLEKDDNGTCRIPCDWSLMSPRLRNIYYVVMVINFWAALITTVITLATLASFNKM